MRRIVQEYLACTRILALDVNFWYAFAPRAYLEAAAAAAAATAATVRPALVTQPGLCRPQRSRRRRRRARRALPRATAAAGVAAGGDTVSVREEGWRSVAEMGILPLYVGPIATSVFRSCVYTWTNEAAFDCDVLPALPHPLHCMEHALLLSDTGHRKTSGGEDECAVDAWPRASPCPLATIRGQYGTFGYYYGGGGGGGSSRDASAPVWDGGGSPIAALCSWTFAAVGSRLYSWERAEPTTLRVQCVSCACLRAAAAPPLARATSSGPRSPGTVAPAVGTAGEDGRPNGLAAAETLPTPQPLATTCEAKAVAGCKLEKRIALPPYHTHGAVPYLFALGNTLLYTETGADRVYAYDPRAEAWCVAWTLPLRVGPLPFVVDDLLVVSGNPHRVLLVHTYCAEGSALRSLLRAARTSAVAAQPPHTSPPLPAVRWTSLPPIRGQYVGQLARPNGAEEAALLDVWFSPR